MTWCETKKRPNEKMKGSYNKDDVIATIIEKRIKDCLTTRDILSYLQGDLEYSKSQAYKLLADAREEIKEHFDATNPTAINEAIAQYESIMVQLLKDKSYKLWNEYSKELNKMKGLYTEKVQITGELAIKDIEIIINKRDED